MRNALENQKNMLLAERERRSLMAEKQARSEAKTGNPNIIQEQHEGVSNADRFMLKNLGKDANANAQYLAKNNPQLDTRVWDGQVLVKNKNEKEWRTMDPDAEGFGDGIGEFIKDAGDIVYDVGSGIVEGVGTAAGAVGGAIFGGGGGSIPAAMLTNAALSGASEATRQNLGSAFGIEDNVDYGDVATTAALGGIIPMVPAAAMKGLKMAKAPIKGTAKFLAGVDEDTVQAMTREGEKQISKMEADTVVPTLEKMAKSVSGEVDKIKQGQIDRVEQIKNTMRLDNDKDVIKALKAEQKQFKKQNKWLEADAIQKDLDAISETSEVRKVIDDIGFQDPELVRASAFPDSIGVEEIESMAPAMKAELDDTLGAIRSEYEALGNIGEDVNISDVKKLYTDKIRKLKATGDTHKIKVAEALEADYKKRFSRVNPDFGSIDIIANRRSEKFIDKADVQSYADTSDIKREIAKDAYDRSNPLQSGVKKTSTTDSIVSQLRSVERLLDKKMAVSSQGLKKELDPEYIETLKAIEGASKYFKDSHAVNRTINRIKSGKAAGKLVLHDIDRIDKKAGTDFGKQIRETIEADVKTKKGVSQAKAFRKASVFAEELAGKSKSEIDNIAEKRASSFEDPSAVAKSITKYASESDAAYNADLDNVVKKFGPEAGETFKDYIDDMKLSAIFGDASKTKMKEIGGEQVGSTLSSALQGAAWQLPGGAAMSRIGGTVGKAVGTQLPVRKLLRATLPAYFEKKAAIKGLSDTAKKELEQTIGDTMIKRKDLIRELSKKLGTVDEN